VKANNVGGGSVADLRKKTKGSISSLNKVRLREILYLCYLFFVEGWREYQWFFDEHRQQGEEKHKEFCKVNEQQSRKGKSVSEHTQTSKIHLSLKDLRIKTFISIRRRIKEVWSPCLRLDSGTVVIRQE
jgi:hypothetical protein